MFALETNYQESYFTHFPLATTFYRIRNHASQICLLLHTRLPLCTLSITHQSILPHHKNYCLSTWTQFGAPRTIDWLNYGFPASGILWRLINDETKQHFYFMISVHAHQLNVIAFWCVAFVCAAAVMLNNVSRPPFIFASKLIIRHFRSVVICCLNNETVQKGVEANTRGAALKSKILLLAPSEPEGTIDLITKRKWNGSCIAFREKGGC